MVPAQSGASALVGTRSSPARRWRPSAIAVLLYTAHNAANAVAAYPAGALADAIGRRLVLVVGVALFAAACVAFAFSPTSILQLGLRFIAVGTSTALVETAEGATPQNSCPRRSAAGDTGSSGSWTRSATWSRAWSSVFCGRWRHPPGASDTLLHCRGWARSSYFPESAASAAVQSGRQRDLPRRRAPRMVGFRSLPVVFTLRA
jgi:MFS family permease